MGGEGVGFDGTPHDDRWYSNDCFIQAFDIARDTAHLLEELEGKYTGLEQILIAFPMGATQSQFREQLTRFAKEVMPAFRAEPVGA